MEKNCKNIVLIGGGYASVWAYRSLVKELLIDLMHGFVKIWLVCPEEFHYFHGWTAESFAGIIGDENRMSPLSDIFEFAEIVKGKLTAIHTDDHLIDVCMTDGSIRSLPYDQLLLGTGSSDASCIEGLTEYAYQLKSHNAYLRAKNRVQFLLGEAAKSTPTEASRLLRFVIAGGGFTGIEFAANLAEMLALFIHNHPRLQHVKPAIYLVNSKKDLLPGLEPRFRVMRQYAEKTLMRYGIEIIHQRRMTRVIPQGAFFDDGSFIDSRMVISTIGQSRQILNGTENMEKDGDNRILSNHFLQLKNHSCIWGAGDAVQAGHPVTGRPCPPNALWAIKQGEHAGRNIARAMLNRPLKAFAFKGLGQCASLGVGKGLGELWGIQFKGWFAWIIRWIFFQYFMPLRRVMWREIVDWMFLLCTRRRRYLDLTAQVNAETYSYRFFMHSHANQSSHPN